jgi:aldose 1-epimerase
MTEFFELTNPSGVRVVLTNVGASLVSAHVPDRDGNFADVLLGFDAPHDYLSNPSFFGSTPGRYANRIAHARFTLDGTDYQLATNDDPHHLHGGPDGFSTKIWDAEVTPHLVRFSRSSPDGESGYPGNLHASVTFELTDDHSIDIRYEATTDAPTILNLTNHAYFNLAGEGTPTIADHELTIPADRFVEPSATVEPTGALPPVADTPLDFRAPRPIGTPDLGFPPLRATGGYDHSFVLPPDGYQPAATAHHPATGRTLEVLTDQPAIHFYGGNFLTGETGKGGKPYPLRSAFCLEAQHYPDSPNHPSFPTTTLRPNQTYTQRTTYRFSTK